MLKTTGSPLISSHAAIIYTLDMVSAADRDMKTAELSQIGRFVTQLPAFADYDASKIVETAQECAVMLQVENGLERTLAQVAAALPGPLRETAYLLACEVAAIDGRIPLEEMRMLQKIRSPRPRPDQRRPRARRRRGGDSVEQAHPHSEGRASAAPRTRRYRASFSGPGAPGRPPPRAAAPAAPRSARRAGAGARRPTAHQRRPAERLPHQAAAAPRLPRVPARSRRRGPLTIRAMASSRSTPSPR
jgi:tellurite resistance protein